MIELPLLFMAGMLGSSHCLGMCGPFALAVGSVSPHWRSNLWRQSWYTTGRVFTYAVLGAAAGFGGLRLTKAWPGAVNVSAILAIVAGLFLIYQGLLAAGVIRKRGVGEGSGCLAGSMLRTLLRARGTKEVFLAGLFTGLLPCGLLYGMLALATSTSDLGQGALVMIVFGLGTMPAMVAAGVGGSLLSVTMRRRVYAMAAWCLVLTGVVSIARGAGYLEIQGRPAPGCPLCTPGNQAQGISKQAMGIANDTSRTPVEKDTPQPGD